VGKSAVTKNVFFIMINHGVALAFGMWAPFGAAIAFAWIHFVIFLAYLFFNLKNENEKAKMGTFVGMALFNMMLIICGLSQI
jgi:hypothetical protein